MGAVHRHNFDIVRKGYAPDAVDEVILELTIARNDSEALITKLQKQLEQGTAGTGRSGDADRIVSDAKTEAHRLLDEARRQAEATMAKARTDAHRVMTEAQGTPERRGPATHQDPADLTRILDIARIFEQELSKITKGTLGDVSTLANNLERALQDAPQARAAAAPPPDASPASEPRPKKSSGGGSTLDRLRKVAADNRTDTTLPADEPRIEELVAAGEVDLPPAIKARIAAAEAENAAPAVSEEQTETPASTESTSLKARLAKAAADGGSPAVVDKPDDGSPAGESTSLRARIARAEAEDAAKKARTAPGSTAHEIANSAVDDKPAEESTSLASRIARERALDASEEEEETQDSSHGSFYSRRSARLPRIGEEAAAGALAAVRSVRQGGEGAAPDDDERAAQTA